MTDKIKFETGSSLLGATWYTANVDGFLENEISVNHSLPIEIASILAGKNIPVSDVQDFLNPSIKNEMIDPLKFKDMDLMIDTLSNAITNNKTIAIFGDYDVDGATSTAIFIKYLSALGINVLYHIPSREEGYGANIDSFKSLKQQGADLIVCVDCGTTSFDVMEQAKELNIAVCVIDHHIAEAKLPDVKALVNPNRLDDESGMGYICAVGVCFYVLVGLNRHLRDMGHFEKTKEPNLLNWLDLVGLGTVCDVMPLTGINRAFVNQGLKVITSRTNTGLKHLSDVAGIDSKIKSYHLGFILGPRLNAGGRMGDSGLATKILLSNDDTIANQLAGKANDLNKQRQSEEEQILFDINNQIEIDGDYGNFICVFGNDWNEGIVGICASRLKEKHNKPAIVISFKDGMGKGSARSVGNVDIGTILVKAMQMGIVEKGGGHKMAGGLSIAKDKKDEFIEYLKDEITVDVETKQLVAQKVTSVKSLSIDLCKKLSKLEPFGVGNSEPKFILKDVLITSAKVINDKHVSFYLKDYISGDGIKAICFNCFDSNLGKGVVDNTNSKTVSVLGKVKIDTWNGKENLSFIVEDVCV
ncbi:MAG: single-stranded-DNA-specific exonuclease RecJ [Alphaproteobacteria bacterium]